MTQNLEEYSWADDPLWYKDAIIYQLHVKAFFDSDGDGTGDFRGLAQKLEYIQQLGVNCIWLLPFYPSPMKDDGYDISDYYEVAPRYGTKRDFRAFIREAHRRGLKVITELVINHTSDQHPWFQAARAAPPHSPKRHFFVWSDTDKAFPETRIIFTDTETSNWAWDPVAKAYYWHRFFSHQPDLNHNNPRVVEAVVRVMRFWLDCGVDGMRLDAVPYLCVREGSSNENLPETHAVIKRIRAAVDAQYRNRMLLAEANQWPEDVRDYFGDEDECHMAYHFPLMPRMYMAVAQEDRHPIVEIMRQTPEIPAACQWAIFLRNHDELTLEMVTDRERDYMYDTFARDPGMRLNLGIRRRLAPLMDNSIDKIKLMNMLLLSMPGSPIIYYGDEIGMGDNYFLGDRNGVRTPMQWSPDRNGGFSRADPERLYLPVIMDPIYGYQAVNVEAQSRDPSSLLHWMRRVIEVRKAYRCFGRGSLHFLRPGNRKILAYVRQFGDTSVLCVANLSRRAQPVELDLSPYKGRVPVELMGQTPFPPIGELPYLLTLPGYMVYWFDLKVEAEVPAWHEESLPPPEIHTIVLLEGWETFFPEQLDEHGRSRARKVLDELEQDVLPHFIPAQRWFGAKGAQVERVEILERAAWPEATQDEQWILSWVRVTLKDREPEIYFLPLALLWRDEEDLLRALGPLTLARVRHRSRIGVLCDALSQREFCLAMARGMRNGLDVPLPWGNLRFSSTSRFEELLGTSLDELEVTRPAIAGTNTSVLLGRKLFLKTYRRPAGASYSELEIGRFLTESAPFDHVAPIAGALEQMPSGEGEPVLVALLQGYVENQGDAWTYTEDYLQRFADDYIFVRAPEELDTGQEEFHAAYLHLMRTLGRRTAELHERLCRRTGDPLFDPEPITPEDLARWRETATKDFCRAMELLQDRRTDLPPAAQEAAERVIEEAGRIRVAIAELLPDTVRAVKTRNHGDYHLGQVLVTENDFMIIDFEGEPARSAAERRAKASALRDVAGMLRSFDYAAHAAIERISEARRHEGPELEPLVLEWSRLSSKAFLAGYDEAIAGCPTRPEDPEEARRMIEFFVLEKVLYEIRYEIDNRPAWTRIPLAGLCRLLEDSPGFDGENETRWNTASRA